MACGGWDYCTRFLESGGHSGYEVDSQRGLDYAMTDLEFTRGTGKTNDRAWAWEIDYFGVADKTIWPFAIDKLEHLAVAEGADIKSSACLQLWIYTQDQVEDRFKNAAASSLQTAHCQCVVKPDGNEVCQ